MARRGENIRKRSDGRWEGRYIKAHDITGKAIYGSVYAKTYVEVKRKLLEANLHTSNQALPLKDQKKTFREVLYLWLESNRIKLKPQTYANYHYMIETHLLPSIDTMQISDVDSRFVNAFLLQKSINGRLDGKGSLSPSYVKKIAFIMNAALEYASKQNLCTLIRGEISTPPKKKRELEVLTLPEQTKLDMFLSSNFKDRDIGILLSLYAGLRIGEVCGLMCTDFNFETQTVHIRHTVERIKNMDAKVGENKTVLMLCDTKTISSDRIVPIPPILISRIKEIIDKGNVFLLEGGSYEFTDPRSYQYYFSKRLNEGNFRRINYHALRHTFATRCIESGMDIKSLSEILGHASVNITLNTYVHSSIDHKRNQMEKMVAYCGQ